MLFDNFVAAESALLWGGFVLALILGLVVNKTNFCTMGAVSEFGSVANKEGEKTRSTANLLSNIDAKCIMIIFYSVKTLLKRCL